MKKAIPVVLILSFFVLLFPGPAAANLPIVFGKQSGYAPFEKVDTVTESPFGTDAELLRVDILGIRQGDCILITCGGETMLVDGGETIRFDFVHKYFEDHGIGSLNYMFLTHAHDDHLEVQQRLLKRGFPVDAFYSPYDEKDTWQLWKPLLQVLKSQGVPYYKVVTGDVLHVGEAELTVYRNTTAGLSMNDQSAALMIRYKDASIFLAADIAGETQHWLCDNYGEELDADILKSPHHGITANVKEFLEKVSPALVVITNARTNVEKYDAQLDRLDIPRYFIMDTVHLETDGAMWYAWTDKK